MAPVPQSSATHGPRLPPFAVRSAVQPGFFSPASGAVGGAEVLGVVASDSVAVLASPLDFGLAPAVALGSWPNFSRLIMEEDDPISEERVPRPDIESVLANETSASEEGAMHHSTNTMA